MKIGRTSRAWILLAAALALLAAVAACGGGGEAGPTPTPSPGEQTTTISAPSGEVLVMKAGTEAWVDGVSGMKLGAGDSLKTGTDGHVLLLFFEGSVMEVEAGTEVNIGELDVVEDTGSTLIRLQQAVGSTLNRVHQLVDPASSYEVEAPAGVAAVRGTVFAVDVDESGYTVVKSDEGTVWFTAAGETVAVGEGMQTSASPGGTPGTPQAISTPSPTMAVTPTPAPTSSAGETLGDMWSESAYLGPVKYDWVIMQAGQPSVTMTVWVEDYKWRYDQSAGGSEVVQLLDYNAQTMYTYFPEQNMAYRTDFEQAPQRPIEQSESDQQITPTVLGTETVDGKVCLVIEWSINDMTMKTWVWRDHGFPVRMEQVTPQGTTTMEWKNIEFGDIPDSTFQLPSGVQIITFPSQ